MSTTATETMGGPFLAGILVLGPGWTLISGGSVCKSLRNLVGASGFEPPTSWSRTRGQRFCRVLRRFADLPYSPSSACVFNGLRAAGFACVCTQLQALVARKGQEKGKVCGAPEIAPDHFSDPHGFCRPIVLKKLTKPGALILSLSSTYSTLLLIEAACRMSVFATTSGSRSYRLRRNVLGPIAVIE